MPLPTPGESETERQFVDRCMGDETMVSDYEDEKQRAAVCYRQWRTAEAAASDVTGAEWTTAYVNDLPDSAFLYVEPGGEKDADGKTTPRSLRHFPYRDKAGKADLPHLRNALARIPQSKLPQDVKDRLVKKAERLLDEERGAEAAAATRSFLLSGSLQVLAAAGPAKTPRLHIVAYTGEPMRLNGWMCPVVVHCTGLKLPAKLPILADHDVRSRVGHGVPYVRAHQLEVDGVISVPSNPAAQELLESAPKGFPWGASIGADATAWTEHRTGSKFEANGRTYEAGADGLIEILDGVLKEVSVVPLAADDKTDVRVAASATKKEGTEMPEEVKTVNAQPPPAAAPTAPPAAPPAPAPAPALQAAASSVDAILADATAARERERQIIGIIEAAARMPGADFEALRKIGVTAIRESWAVRDVELAVMKAGRPAVQILGQRPDARPTQPVLEAALLLAAGVPEARVVKDRDYGEQVVSQAWPLRNLGLHGVLAAALRANGVEPGAGGKSIFAAMVDFQRSRAPRLMLGAADFSTVDLPGMLGNVANKILLDSFTAVEACYERIAQQAEFTNFHTHRIYRLDHTGEFALVPPTGEIQHGALSEKNYSNKLETYGQMLTLSRQDIVNDDLGALRQLTSLLGRKARIAVERAFFTIVMEAADVFYTVGQGNRLTGLALSVANLGPAEAAMLGMVDASGDPIYSSPVILLVPPGLKFLADQLYTSGTVVGGGAKTPADNPWRGRLRPESSPYLASAALAGSSATTWYVLANPDVVPAFQVAYLQGKRTPTIESKDADFNTLGVSFRAFFDFGVARLDYRGAVKCSI